MADYGIVREALDRGYTLDEIADKLSMTSGFDPVAIRERGYGAPDILAKLGYEPPAPEQPEQSDTGDTMRGLGTAFKQVPQLGYGLIAAGGATLEKVTGEGGIATGIKQAGVKGFEEWGDKIAATSKESDSFTYSWEKAKEGDFGALVDWMQYGIGYAGGQAVQILGTAGVGALAAKGAGIGASKLAAGMVAKESARIAATKEGAALTADALAKLATANVASSIGRNTALAATAFGMEGGEIGGDLVASAEREGRQLTGAELGKAFGATIASGGLEFVGDKIGLDLMLGKGIGKMSGVTGRAARGAAGAAAGIATEGGTEYLQTGIEEYGKGTESSILPFMQSEQAQRQAFDAAALGGLGGAVMGATGGAMSRPEKAEQTPEKITATITSQPTLDDAIKATNEVIDDPVGKFVAQSESPEPQPARDIGAISDFETGFGKVNELADLVAQEKTDIGQRREGLLNQQAETRQLMQESDLETKDSRVAMAQAAESRTARLNLLDSIYSNQDERTPAMTFLARLEQEFPRNPIPTPEEKAFIAQRENAFQAFKDAPQEPEPTAKPNIPREPEVQIAKVDDFLSRGYLPANGGRILQNEQGKKLILNKAQREYVKNLPKTEIPASEIPVTQAPSAQQSQEIGAPVQTAAQPIQSNEFTNSLSRTASWVIRNKESGEVIAETFDRKRVNALNTAKFEAVPIGDYLAGLNNKEQADDIPATPANSAPDLRRAVPDASEVRSPAGTGGTVATDAVRPVAVDDKLATGSAQRDGDAAGADARLPDGAGGEAVAGTKTRDATPMERIRASGKSITPYLNLDKTPTGWKRLEGANNDSVTLVSVDGKKAVTFKSADTKSRTESVRMNAEAHAYAIDNPYQIETPQGELVINPVFQSDQPAQSAEITQKAAPTTTKGKPLPIWQQTRAEYVAKQSANVAPEDRSIAVSLAEHQHKNAVTFAMRSNKPVTDSVLADYPNIKQEIALKPAGSIAPAQEIEAQAPEKPRQPFAYASKVAAESAIRRQSSQGFGDAIAIKHPTISGKWAIEPVKKGSQNAQGPIESQPTAPARDYEAQADAVAIGDDVPPTSNESSVVQPESSSAEAGNVKQAVSFVRSGDFWNYTGDRAKEIAKALDVTVTERNGKPMVGIPDYAKDQYAQQLSEAGIDAEFGNQPAQPSAESKQSAKASINASDLDPAAKLKAIEALNTGALSPEDVKSVVGKPESIESKETDDGEALASRAESAKSGTAPFYSQLSRAVDGAPDRLFQTGKQVALWLQANAPKLNVKKDELHWSGVIDWLQTQGKVTKDDVLGYLASNGVQVEEVTLGSGKETIDQRVEERVNNDIEELADDVRADYWYESLREQAANEGIELSELDRNEREELLDRVMTRQERVDFIRDEMGDSMRDEARRQEEGNDTGQFDETKFSSYAPPGGKQGTYRELLLTLPSKQTTVEPLAELPEGYVVSHDRTMPEGMRYAIIPPGQIHGRPYGDIRGGTPEEAKSGALEKLNIERQMQAQQDDDVRKFRSSHFDQPNILAHLRIDEVEGANGERLLRVVEAQSDWGQEGRKKGFLGEQKKADDEIAAKYPVSKDRGQWSVKHLEDAGVPSKVADKWYEAHMQKGQVPDAPFVQDTQAWLSLAIKKAISYAAENGMEGIVFATGQQNADLYDLSKQVDELRVGKVNGAYDVAAMKGKSVIFTEYSVDENRLADLVGKDIAEKIVARGAGVYSGLDLKVGGEGMRAFYDKIVPQTADKVLKQIGADVKVSSMVVNTEEWKSSGLSNAERARMAELSGMNNRGELNGRANRSLFAELTELRGKEKSGFEAAKSQQQGFMLTDAMRAKVQTEGLPLFSKRDASTRTAGQTVAAVKQATKALRNRWLGFRKIEIVQSDSDLPQEFREGVLRSGVDPTGSEGWFDPKTKTVYLVADNLASPERSVWVSIHETVGHGGVRMLGKSVADALDFAGKNGFVQKLAKAIAADRGETFNARTHTDEALAELAAATITDNVDAILNRYGVKVPAIMRQNLIGSIQRIIDAVRTFMAKVLGREVDAVTDAEVYGLLRQMREAVEGKADQAARADGGYALDSRAPATPQQGNIPLQGGKAGNNASWDSPEASKLDNIIYTLQDKHIDMKRVVESIKEAGGNLVEKFNPYLAEELFHGRAAKRTKDFVNTELKPLLADMRLRGIDVDEMDQYLHARHAKEANALIEQRDPGVIVDKTTGDPNGSGMTDSQADKYLSGLGDKRKRLEASAAKVDAIIAKTRDLYASYALESKDTVDGWATMFQHYVPLMREDNDGGMGIGQGFSIKGKEAKHRTGSSAKVVDILANIALQREKAITRGEKNRVATALSGLAKLNPNPDFWTFDKPPTERVLMPKRNVYEIHYQGSKMLEFSNMPAAKAFMDYEGGAASGYSIKKVELPERIEERVDPMFKSRPNVVIAKIKDASGQIQERAVIFNDRNERALRMAEAFKNLDAVQLGGVMGVSAMITRYFASINTQYNPIFGIVNIVRDVQGMAFNLGSTPIAQHRADVIKLIPSAVKGIYQDSRAEREGHSANSKWAQMWEELQDEGGMTGYRDLYRNSEDRADSIKSELDPYKWHNNALGKVFTANGALKVPLKVAQNRAGWLFDWLSDYNQTLEGATRLATYKVARDNGMTKQQAASLAKNITVNFNRKGHIGQQAGAMYAFFNAAMQGTARIAQTMLKLENGKIELTTTGKAIVYGGITLGALQALALAFAGFDDDEPPEFVRERALIIPVGGKKYLTLPMPLGFHVLPNIGRIPTEWALNGFKDTPERIIHLLGTTIEAFNPLGSAGMSLQTIMPTALDPFTALAENKDWTGKPIYKEDFNSMKPTPGFDRNKDTATAWSKGIAEALNYMSGGTDYVPGAISPTADQIDYLIAQVTGGVGRELSKAAQAGGSVLTGEELPPHKMPLVGRFYGDSGAQSSQGNAYYANLKRINEVEAEIKGRRENREPIDEYKRDNPEWRLIGRAKFADKVIRNLRKRKRELIEQDAPREKIKAIEDRITAEMQRLNEAARKLEEK
jgi:hypothetical protein